MLQQQYVVAQYCSTFRVRILDSRLFRFTLSVGCSLKSKGVFIVGIEIGKLVFQGNFLKVFSENLVFISLQFKKFEFSADRSVLSKINNFQG